MDTIQLNARLDAIEKRLNLLDADGDRFPSHGTRGSLSRPVIDGGLQPRDVHKLNDVPVDRDDDLMPEGDDDQADQVDQANGEQAAAADQPAPRRRSAKTANRRGAPSRRRR